MIDAIILDMDGLMFNTEIMFQDEFKDMNDQLGMNIPKEISKLLIGCDSRKSKELEKMYPGISTVMEHIQADRMHYFFEYFKEPGSANMPGLEEFIHYLDQNKIVYAIASSSAKKHIELFLDHAGFKISPKAIISGKEGYRSKPFPDIFLACAKALKVDPENCLVLEDSKHGIMAAKNAKMKSVFIQDQIEPDAEMENYIQDRCDSLYDVIDYLEAKKL